MTGPGSPTHPREKFDGYAQILDLGQWHYEIDDFEVSYGAGRWFPFGHSVRLAPSLAYRSWRNEYVLLWPGRRAHEATATLTIALRARGMGAVTVGVHAALDLRGAGAVTLRPDDLTDEPRATALVKAGRVLDLIRRERQHRRRGQRRPITAHDRHQAAEQ